MRPKTGGKAGGEIQWRMGWNTLQKAQIRALTADGDASRDGGSAHDARISAHGRRFLDDKVGRARALAFMVGAGGRGVIVVCHATKIRSIGQCARGVPPT